MTKKLSEADAETRARELYEQSMFDADKHLEYLEEQREQRRERVMRAVAGKRFIYNPLNAAALNATIKKVARKNNIMDKVPTKKFGSAEEFVAAVLDTFQDNKVSEEDLELITSTFEKMKKEGVHGKSKD